MTAFNELSTLTTLGPANFFFLPENRETEGHPT
jgi:hypothetical protein